MKKKVVVDTSVFMEGSIDLIVNLIKEYEVIVPMKVFDELDNLKDNGKDRNKKFKARRAINIIEELYDELTMLEYDYEIENSVNDKVIVYTAKKEKASIITFDIGMTVRARLANVNVINQVCGGDVLIGMDNYKGYKLLEIDTMCDDDQLILDSIYKNENILGMRINEYIVIRDKSDDSTIDIRRWTGEEFVKLMSPINTKIIPANDLQRCAIDILINPDILVKGVFGNAGCGKTYLAVKAGLHQLKTTEEYEKMLLVRNPVGPGEDIGYLQGDKNGKIEDFFRPVIQHLENGKIEAEAMKAKETLEFEIPKFMKGLDIKDTYIFVDEAEDLDCKIIKLLGTRVSEGSCIVFTGDYSQSENKFKDNNGIKELIKRSAGNSIFAYIVLEEDLRSDASKMFSSIF